MAPQIKNFISNIFTYPRSAGVDYEETEGMFTNSSVKEGNTYDLTKSKGDGIFVEESAPIENDKEKNFHRWEPTGNSWRDFLYFVGPGWFVSIAYVDPGNYQADIQAGAKSRYNLLFAVWWTTLLSVYVQVLCVRLAYYGQVTLAEAQARDRSSKFMRYMNWFIAEMSAIVNDLPVVIGIGIALHIFFGWPYYAGVILSLITTMMFLASQNFGMQVLEMIIFVFVSIMSVALLVEMSFVGVDSDALMKGWLIGFTEISKEDIFSITGILGSVVTPHNLYLHTAACQSRRVKREEHVVRQAVKWCSIEPIIPILVSFFVNMAVVAIAAESVYGVTTADEVGITGFCEFFKTVRGGCVLWGIALLAAGQSSAITTTFSGAYIMDGFLSLRLPTSTRAVISRLVAITPSIIISVAFPDQLNRMVNIVNSSLSILLPFAFTPLIKYNCSDSYMGKYAATRWEKCVLYFSALLLWSVNAYSLSAVGGGFFGDCIHGMEFSAAKVFYIFLEVVFQLFYFWWNAQCLLTPVSEPMTPLEEERPFDEQFSPVIA